MKTIMAALVALSLVFGLLPHAALADDGVQGERVHVTFFGPDHQTVLSSAEVAHGQSLLDAQATPDILACEGESQIPVLRQLGSYFAGWAERDGKVWPYDAPLTGDLALYPAYETIGVAAAGASGVSVDVSQAFMLRTDMAQAANVEVKLERADAGDPVLEEAVADENGVCGCFRATFGFDLRGDRQLVKKSFGLVTFKLPVSQPDKTRVRCYWLASDGTAKRTAVKNVSAGTVVMNWADYDVGERGNIVVALAKQVADDEEDEQKSADEPVAPAAGDKKADGSAKGSGARSDQASKSANGSSASKTAQKQVSDKTSAKSSDGKGSKATKAGSSKASHESKTSSSSSSTSRPAQSGSGYSGSHSASGSVNKNTSSVRAVDDSDGSDEPTDAVVDEQSQDDVDSGTYSGNDALDSVVAPHDDGGSREGGMLYGLSMLVIAGLACAAWWIAVARKKKNDESDGAPA